jgi:hypothetical protein
MKPISLLFSVVLCHAALAAENGTLLNFDSMTLGSTPEGWKSGYYGKDGKPRWAVTPDTSAPSKPNVLKQDGKATYNWLVKEGLSIENGKVQTQVRIDSGKEDPEAGVIWRFKDGKNYYYVRANALEKNITLYRMSQGKKEMIKTIDLPLDFGEWHSLGAQFKGATINVLFDGKTVLSVQDKKTQGTGLVGFFTMADTACTFDDFEATPSK